MTSVPASVCARPAVIPLLRQSLRPFFLGAALWAPLALVLWLALLAGTLSLPLAFDALAWHQHELLFGYAGGVIAGFLLTAALACCREAQRQKEALALPPFRRRGRNSGGRDRACG